MFKVANSRPVRDLANRIYCKNFRKNLLMIAAIFLTTVLIAAVLFIGSVYYQSLILRNRYMNGMDYDIALTEPTEKQVAAVKEMDKVKYAGVCVKCAILTDYEDKALDKVRLFWADDTCYEKQLRPALASFVGKYPVKENEILLSENTLKAMGISEPEIGMEFPLSYYDLKQSENEADSRSQTFRLSGFFKDYTGRKSGYVSKSFLDETGVKQTDFTQGVLNITLKNPLYSKADIVKMNEKLHLDNRQVMEGDDNAIVMFIRTMIGLGCVLLLVFGSGYLFIYNIQYISIRRDIRDYGQLKTLGTTRKQLRKIVNLQMFYNAMAGITFGIAGMILAGVPVMNACLKEVSDSVRKVVWNREVGLAMVIAGLFSFCVVFLGGRKPRLLAEKATPVEAMKYIGEGIGKTAGKRHIRSESVFSMAYQNLWRDKKQFVIILLSLSTAVTLFLVVNSIILSNQASFILDQVSDDDMTILNLTLLEDSEQQVLDRDLITQLRQVEGIKAVRELTGTTAVVPYQKIYAEYYKELYKSRYTPGDYASDMADYKEHSDNEQFTCRIIGVDEEEFRILNQSAGEKLDADEFEDGKVCFACKFFTEGDNHIPGHSVRFVLSKDGQDMKCRIKVGAMLDSNPAYYSAGYSPDLIVSKSYVKRLLGDAALTEMLKIDYKNAYDKKTEDEIKQLMKGNEKVSLESKLGRLEEMKKEENRIRLLGNTIASLIAVMAILNFVNMICASLEQRRNEFAIMESIGMTRRQQRKMIVLEAVMYAGISIVISCFAGIPLSVLAFNNFKRYAIHFVMPVVSDLGVFLFILCVCAVASLVAFSQMRKMSIVELMKNNV